MSTPSLSVMMANYNHARFIPEALDAILAQSYRPCEIVIIDDGSTDDSVAVLERYQSQAQGLIRLIKNERNEGPLACGARQTAMATGDYVYFAAMDDRILPGFFERSMALLARHPGAAFCSALSRMMTHDGTMDGLVKMPIVLSDDGFIDPQAALQALRRHGNWVQGNTTILRRAALAGIGGYRRELSSYSDGFGYLVMALKYGACYIPEPLAVWRRASGTYSSRENSNLDAVLSILERAEHLMRTDYRELFPDDYIAAWKREMYFGVATGLAQSPDAAAVAQLERLVPRLSAADRAFCALVRTWPALGRRLAKPYLFARLRPDHIWRMLGRRLMHARLAIRYN